MEDKKKISTFFSLARSAKFLTSPTQIIYQSVRDNVSFTLQTTVFSFFFFRKITFPRAHPDCSLSKFNSRVARVVTFIWAAVVDWLNLKLQWAPLFWLVDCFHKTRQYRFCYSNANLDLFYSHSQFNSASVRLSVTHLLAHAHTHTHVSVLTVAKWKGHHRTQK